MVVATAALLVLTSVGQASSTRQTISLTARLTPAELTHRPVGIKAGARGSFAGSFRPYEEGWETARYSLTTRRLTGPVLRAHIHTGVPGRNGPVLLTLCDSPLLQSGRCNVSSSTFHAYPVGFIKTMRILGAYVDVHTRRNPRGELRSQIVFAP